MRIKIFVLVSLITVFILQGCAQTDAIYESAKSFEATDEELQMLINGDLAVEIGGMSVDGFTLENGTSLEGGSSSESGIGAYFKNLGYNFFESVSKTLKKYWLYGIGASLLIGFVMIRLSPKAIKVRRIGWFFFIIGIPVLILILLFGSAFIADAFI